MNLVESLLHALKDHGARVGTRAELKAVLDKALVTRGRFHLVAATLPRGVLSATLQRFVAGVKRLSAAN